MSNYSKTTNFAVKDALITGDPLKVVKGTDINTEFDNIATAIATKTDNAGAAITAGTITGATINNSTIGATTPTTGAFTTVAASGLVTANGGETVASGQTLTLTGATVAGAPTWSSNQAITLSTAAQPNITSVGTLTSVTTSGAVTITAATSKLIPGATSFSHRNSADSADNLLIADSGAVTGRSSLVWGTGVANFGMLVKRKTADETVTSSITLQDDDHLLFSIAANEEWVMTYEIRVNAAGGSLGTTGVKVAITVPSGATMDLNFFGKADTDTVFGGTGNAGSSGTPAFAVTPAGTGSAILRGWAWVLNGANAGSVTLQWAQNASSGSPLVFKKGSFMQATRIA